MAHIEPFRGLRYDTEVVGPLASVVAPPYDVISPEQRRAYRARNPYNIVHLTLPHRYEMAAYLLRAWREEGALVRDAEPALYVLEEEFALPGQEARKRTTLVGRMRLENYEDKVVFPHEQTTPGPKADRLSLMCATNAQLSAVFGIYEDPTRSLPERLRTARPEEPLATLTFQAISETGEETTEGGMASGIGFTRQSLWAITDAGGIKATQEALAPLPIIIADGHHRYETALAYRDEQRAMGNTGAESVLMGLTEASDPGLCILPSQRLVQFGTRMRPRDALERLRDYFHIENLRTDPPAQPPSTSQGEREAQLVSGFSRLEETAGKALAAILCLADYSDLFLLILKEQARQEFGPDLEAAPGVELDVCAVEKVAVEAGLGVPREAISITHDAHDALQGVEAGKAQAAFLLRPTTVEQLQTVVRGGGRMPPKTTFFYPKLLAGLVVDPLSD